MAMMLSPFIELRNATPAFFVASNTRARASTSTWGIWARWTLYDIDMSPGPHSANPTPGTATLSSAFSSA